MSYDYLKDIRSTVGDELEGRRIALCVTGSVSAYRAVDIARLLIRHGADVVPVLTKAALKVVTPHLLLWATGNKPVVELSGAVEHVGLAGKNPGRVDAVLVAPCTANTIAKIACGIDDTPVTSVVSVALGSGVPVFIAPAMHEPMYQNPFILENLEKLRRAGVTVVEPSVEEGKAKLAPPEKILVEVASKVGKRLLAGLRVLVTAGPTREHIDPIRVITNPSSGKMGYSVALEAKLLGAQVYLVSGPTQIPPPPVDWYRRVESTQEMLEAVLEALSKGVDIAVFAAAPADYTPETKAQNKISTRQVENLELKLKPTPKIIVEAARASPGTVIVGFKAEHGLTDHQLVEAAKQFMAETGAHIVVANDYARPGAAFEHDTNQGVIVGPAGQTTHIPTTTKHRFAQKILEYVAQNLPALKEYKPEEKLKHWGQP